MSNATTQKNANRTCIAGTQSMEKTTRNACQCTPKQQNISTVGGKQTMQKMQTTMTLRQMVNIAKVV